MTADLISQTIPTEAQVVDACTWYCLDQGEDFDTRDQDIADWEADVGKPEEEAHWPEHFATVEDLEGWIAEQRADLAAHGDRKFVEVL